MSEGWGLKDTDNMLYLFDGQLSNREQRQNEIGVRLCVCGRMKANRSCKVCSERREVCSERRDSKGWGADR